jgi:hypothetical protein
MGQLMADEKPEYLGDGVYASFDGWHIWLKTGSHDDPGNKIALEPSVYEALMRYHAKLVLSVLTEAARQGAAAPETDE